MSYGSNQSNAIRVIGPILKTDLSLDPQLRTFYIRNTTKANIDILFSLELEAKSTARPLRTERLIDIGSIISW